MSLGDTFLQLLSLCCLWCLYLWFLRWLFCFFTLLLLLLLKYCIAECVLLYQDYYQLENPKSANIWPEVTSWRVSADLHIRHYILQVLILPWSWNRHSTMEKVKVKIRLSWRLRMGMEGWASIFTLIFGTTRRAELSALRTSPPRKFLDTHFC